MDLVQVCSTCKRIVEVYCATHPEALVEALRVEHAQHFQHCSHCGHSLSFANIRLALEDIGGGLTLDRITLCCPGHSEDSGCPDHTVEDEQMMAYWYLI